MSDRETLAQLVARKRSERWPSRREADRETQIPYATWQNVEVRGTIPTLPTLAKIADALDVDEIDLLRAAKVSEIRRQNGSGEP